MRLASMVVMGMAVVLQGCTQTRNDISSAVGFLRQANALSSRPDDSGAYPSAFAADAARRPSTTLSSEDRSAAYRQLQAEGAAAQARTRAREAELQAASPY